MAQIATPRTDKAAAEATKAAAHPRAANVARDLTDKAQGTTLRLIEKTAATGRGQPENSERHRNDTALSTCRLLRLVSDNLVLSALPLLAAAEAVHVERQQLDRDVVEPLAEGRHHPVARPRDLRHDRCLVASIERDRISQRGSP